MVEENNTPKEENEVIEEKKIEETKEIKTEEKPKRRKIDWIMLIFFLILTIVNIATTVLKNKEDTTCVGLGFNFTDIRPEYYKCCDQHPILLENNITRFSEQCTLYWRNNGLKA